MEIHLKLQVKVDLSCNPIGFEPFPNGGILNIEAFGCTFEASRSYITDPICEMELVGDTNGDCVVDYVDFALDAIMWLQQIELSE